MHVYIMIIDKSEGKTLLLRRFIMLQTIWINSAIIIIHYFYYALLYALLIIDSFCDSDNNRKYVLPTRT